MKENINEGWNESIPGANLLDPLFQCVIHLTEGARLYSYLMMERTLRKWSEGTKEVSRHTQSCFEWAVFAKGIMHVFYENVCLSQKYIHSQHKLFLIIMGTRSQIWIRWVLCLTVQSNVIANPKGISPQVSKPAKITWIQVPLPSSYPDTCFCCQHISLASRFANWRNAHTPRPWPSSSTLCSYQHDSCFMGQNLVRNYMQPPIGSWKKGRLGNA